MNEAGEADGGGADDSAVDFSGDDADYGDNDDDEPVDQTFNSAFENLGLDPKKYGLDGNQDESPGEEGEGLPAAKDDGQDTDESAFLEQLNSLGAIHNELPIKVESREQLKELIQKGQDYTVKTQALSNERKEWDTEKTAAETELNAAISEFNETQKVYGERLQQLQEWDYAIDNIKENAPDVYEEILRAVQETKKQFSNPVINQQMNALRAELAEAKKGLSLEREDLNQEKNKLIVGSFDTEMNALTATKQSFKELGITIDEAKVKEKWIATGLPVKDVVGMLYYESIAKAQASKSKLATVKQKVNARPAGAAGNSRPGNKVPQIDRKKSYLEQANELFKNMK